MDSRQLRYFREIIESGSLSAAARSLSVAQPSLSQLVRNLEHELNVELLIRTARGISATEAGQRLYRHACLIEAQLEEARDDVVSAGSEPSGRVVFGVPPTVAMALLIPIAETIRLEMPRVRFRAIEAMTGHLREWLMNGDIDMTLLYDNTNIGNCSSSILVAEDLCFYSSPQDWPFPTAPGQPVGLDMIAETDLVLPSERHGLRSFIERIARMQHLSLNVAIEIDSLSQIKALVARGSGYTILSPAAVQDMVADHQLVGAPIGSPQLRRHIYLVRSASRPLTVASRRTEQICREVVADLVDRKIWKAHLPAG
ncbi:LysR substrate-binding domain-containing protein [Paracoccus aerodenitrificans]|uniref:LysR substrate-binding domain-containing protein n=1 Tax=Paracoccus aerodenitrificans TaxID=3017781 RepID=UPI0022F02E2D|nr:LysR substrate-binding domain-containing protein [Paracoccus aerodenitrificans]WBU62769.1 LysR substrate-binding domain-containing protein [Paracoccus aerodenitrificans]